MVLNLLWTFSEHSVFNINIWMSSLKDSFSSSFGKLLNFRTIICLKFIIGHPPIPSSTRQCWRFLCNGFSCLENFLFSTHFKFFPFLLVMGATTDELLQSESVVASRSITKFEILSFWLISLVLEALQQFIPWPW